MTKATNRSKSQSIKARKKNARRARAAAHTVEVVTLYYATCGLQTSLDDYYVDNERMNWEINDWPPNRTWSSVRVRRCDIRKWLAAMNQYLSGAWTPNQGFGHGTCNYEGGQDMNLGTSEMQRLEELAA